MGLASDLIIGFIVLILIILLCVGSTKLSPGFIGSGSEEMSGTSKS